MVSDDKIKELYNVLKDDGYTDLPDEKTFRDAMGDKDKRKELYDAMERTGYSDLPDFNTFDKAMTPGQPQARQEVQPKPQAQPQAQQAATPPPTPVNPNDFQSPVGKDLAREMQENGVVNGEPVYRLAVPSPGVVRAEPRKAGIEFGPLFPGSYEDYRKSQVVFGTVTGPRGRQNILPYDFIDNPDDEMWDGYKVGVKSAKHPGEGVYRPAKDVKSATFDRETGIRNSDELIERFKKSPMTLYNFWRDNNLYSPKVSDFLLQNLFKPEMQRLSGEARQRMVEAADEAARQKDDYLKRKYGDGSILYWFNSLFGNTDEAVAPKAWLEYQQAVANYMDISAMARDASSMADAEKDGTFLAFMRGIGQRLADVKTYDFTGMIDAGREMALSKALEDIGKNGTKASPYSQNLIKAAWLGSAMQGMAHKHKAAYTTGQGVLDTAGFMAQFYLGGKLGAGNISKGIIKAVTKDIGKEGAAVITRKAAAHLLGRSAQAAYYTLLFPGSTIAEYHRQANGDVTGYVDEKGDFVYTGQENQTSKGRAAYNAVMQSFNANMSEMLGDYFPLLGRYLAKTKAGVIVSDALTNVKGATLGALAKHKALRDPYIFLSMLSGNKVARAIRQFQKDAKFSGTFGEYVEEVANNAMDALANDGGATWGDVVDPKQNAQTFIQVLIVSGAMGLFGAVGGIRRQRYKNKLETAMQEADYDATAALGDRWTAIRDRLDNGTEKERSETIQSIVKGTFPPDQKRRMLDYAKARLMYNGANFAEMNGDLDGEKPSDMAQAAAYQEGTAAVPEERNGIQTELQAAMQTLNPKNDSEGDAFASLVRQYEDSPSEGLRIIRETYSPEKAQLAIDYYNARARHAGMLDAASDGVDAQVEQANRQARQRSHEVGGVQVVTPVTILTDAKREDGSVPQNWIVSGMVAQHQDGTVDTGGSDSSIVVVDEAGQMKMVSPADIATVGQSQPLQDILDYNATALRQQLTKAAADSINYDPRVQEPAEGAPFEHDGRQYVVSAVDRNGVTITQLVDGKADGKNAVTISMDDYKKAMTAQLHMQDRQQVEERQGVQEQPGTVAGNEAEMKGGPQTDDVDENGRPFVKASDGSTIFGEVHEESGLAPAPIKLSEGFNKVDDKGNNIGYGLEHIKAGHGEQILKAGYPSVEAFVEDVTRNYQEIRIGRNRENHQTYMLLELYDEKHKCTLYIELAHDGNYWNVNSGGIFANRYTDKKDIVWPEPTVGSNANTDTAGVVDSPTEVAKGETVDRGGNSPQPISSSANIAENPETAKEKGENIAGRSLTPEEADDVVSVMEANAVEAPELELTPDNWVKEFGEDGKLETPIGEVKMGDNQYLKMAHKGRGAQLGMVKPTLTNPDVVIEVPTEAKDGKMERPSSLLFVKTFVNNDGTKHHHFTSVTVSRDGMEVSISNHIETDKRIRNFLEKGKLLYRVYGGAQTEQSRPIVSGTTSPTNAGVMSANIAENPETAKEKEEIPVAEVRKGRKKGTVKLYHKVSPERTIEDLRSLGMDDSTIGDYAQAVRSQAEKDVRSIGKEEAPASLTDDPQGFAEWANGKKARLQDAKERVKYWSGIPSALADLQQREYEAAHPQETEAHKEAVAQAERESRQRMEDRGKPQAETFGQIQQRFHDAPKEVGNSDELLLADNTPVKGHYVLTEANAVTPSHDPFSGFTKSIGFPEAENGTTVNDRDYEHDANAQSQVVAKAAVYNQRAIKNPVVVSRDGVVLSGNDRTMAGQIAARNGTDSQYLSYLREHAGDYGFTAAQVDGHEHPRLIFVPDADLPYTTATFAKFNLPEEKAQGNTEKAVKLSKSVSERAFRTIANILNEKDDINAYYNSPAAIKATFDALVEDGVVMPNQVAGFVNDAGLLNGSGRDFIDNLLLSKVIDDPDAVRKASMLPSLKQCLLKAAIAISENRQLTDGYSLKDKMADAVKVVYEARQSGQPVAGYLSQNMMFGDNPRDIYGKTVQLLASKMEEGGNSLRNVLSLYNNSARDEIGGAGLFGHRSPEDILQELIDYGKRQTERADAAGTPSERLQGGGQTGGRGKGNRLQEKSNAGVQEDASMSDNEVEELVSLMEDNAISTPHIELNPTNWLEQFGQDGTVSTPIGLVKMGENQIAKLFEKGRSEQFGMIKPTLTNPLVVIEEPSKANDGNTERGSSLLFVKTFLGKNGSKVYYFKSVTVKKDGLEVSVSSHYDRPNRIKEALKKGKLLYRFDGGAQTEQLRPTASGTTSLTNTGVISAGKVSKNIPESQTHGDIFAEAERIAKETGKTETSASKVKDAEKEVDSSPSEAQKEAGNYKKGHVNVDGFDVTIENPKGSVRSGTDLDGKKWSVTMNNTYGYIKGTVGVDGDHIDVFLSDNPDDGNVYVVDQVNPDGSFDEHKVMYGFPSEEAAREAYLSNYAKGWKGLGPITEVSKEDFKKWIDSSKRKTKPFAEYKSVQGNEPQPVGKGPFGNIYTQFKGKVKEAITFLTKKKGGEAIAVLHHPEVGDISLVWGDAKAGLEKILQKHPEVVNNLQGILDNMHIVQSSDNRIVLESSTHRAVVSKMLGNKKTNQWLLTAYEKKKKSISAGSSDIDTEPEGKQNGTAPLQNTTSTSKDSKKSSKPQTHGDIFAEAGKVAQSYRKRRLEEAEAAYRNESDPTFKKKALERLKTAFMDVEKSMHKGLKERNEAWESYSNELENSAPINKVDVNGLLGSLYDEGETRLSGHVKPVAMNQHEEPQPDGKGREVSSSQPFSYFKGALSELVSMAQKSAQGLVKKIIAPVSLRLKKDLEKQGIVIGNDYNHVIDNSAVRHILKQHGGSLEEKRGQVPVKNQDFQKIADVVSNYDHVKTEKGKRGELNLLYDKSYPDGTVVFVEEQRKNRKELAALTMWKTKKSTLTDANSKATPISDLNGLSTGKGSKKTSNPQAHGDLLAEAEKVAQSYRKQLLEEAEAAYRNETDPTFKKTALERLKTAFMDVQKSMHKGLKERNEAWESYSNELENSAPINKVDMTGLFGALNTKGEARLSGHAKPVAMNQHEEPQPVGKGPFGNIYTQFKGKVKEAFRFLYAHQSGDLIGVFHRKDIGDIDLVWGDATKNQGLAHIIDKHINRQNDFNSVDEAFSTIESVIKAGAIEKQNENRVELVLGNYKVSIRKDFDGIKKNWVVTAFDYKRSANEKTSPTITRSTPNSNQGGRAVTPGEGSLRKGSKKSFNPQTDGGLFAEAERIAKGTKGESTSKLDNYIAGMSKMQAGRIVKILSQKVKYDDGIRSRAENIERLVGKRTEFVEGIFNGKKEYSYKVKDGFEIQITKTELDYARHLGGNVHELSPEDVRKDRKRVLINKYGLTNIKDVQRDLDRAKRAANVFNDREEAERAKDLQELLDIMNAGEQDEPESGIRFREGPVYTAEEQAVIDKAKADGTYMKAPNDKPTKLTEKQWAQVRTPAFKNWFGDWEKAARIEKLKKSTAVRISGKEVKPSDDLKQYKKNALEYGKKLRGEYTNKDAGVSISLTGGNRRGGIREILQHDYKDVEHLQSIAAIPQIIEESTFIEELPNDDIKKYPGVKSFSYYVCGLKIGDVDYTVKAVVANQNNGNRYYDHKLTNIEKGKLLSIVPTIQKAGIESNSPLSGYKDKRLFSILQTNSSEVVDENGEPLVVYHGTSLSRDQEQDKETFKIDEDWTIKRPKAPFTAFKGGEYGGLIFTSTSEDKAADIGRTRSEHLPDDGQGNEQWTSESYVYDLFANAKRPFNVKDDKAVKSVLDEVGDGLAVYDFYTGIESKISRDEAENMLKGDNSWQVVETSAFQNVVRKHGYDAIIAKDEGVEYVAVYHPNQLKAAGRYLTSLSNNGRFSIEDPDIRFREVKDVEGKKSLVAIHNTTEDNLRKSLGLGGFPMPSIAVTKAEMGHSKFGDISLIFGKDSIDPKNRNNKVYSGDAWTPTFPKIDFKINDKVRTAAANKIHTLAGREVQETFPLSFDEDNLRGKIESYDGDVAAALSNNRQMKYAYLKGNGNAPDIPVRGKSYGMADITVQILSRHGLKPDDVFANPPAVFFDESGQNESLMEDMRKAFAESTVDSMLKSYVERKGRDKLVAKYKERFSFDDFDRMVSDAFRKEQDARKGVQQEVDKEKLQQEIDSRVQPDDASYRKWIADMFKGIIEKEGIRNDKDAFTPSGNRRKWDSLYDAVTMKSVMKNMLSQNEIGGSGLFGNNIFGLSARPYRSLEDLKTDARQRLREIGEEEEKAIRDELVKRFSDVIGRLGNTQDKGIGNYFDTLSAVADAIRKNDTAAGYYKDLKPWYPGVTMELAEDIAKIVNDARSKATVYLEAKPRRAVNFDEVKAAVVPEGTSADIVQTLRDKGIRVETYKPGDEVQRKNLVEKISQEDDLLFRQGNPAETFVARQRAAVENHGTVMPGLNEASVEVVEAKPSGFKSFDEARQWAKAHIERTYDNEETGGKGEIRISHTAVGKFLSEKAVNKSSDMKSHLAVLKVLPQIIRTGIEAEEHPDYRKVDDRRSANSVNPDVLIHRLYGATSIDGKVYRVKVTLKEYAEASPNKAYSYEATKIELLEGTLADVKNETYPRTSNSDGSPRSHKESLAFAKLLAGLSEEAKTSSRYSNNSIPLAKLLQGVEKSYDKGKYLLDESGNLTNDGRYRIADGETTDDAVSYGHDPLAKMLGGSYRTSVQKKAFAARERQRMQERASTVAGKLGISDDVEIVTDASGLNGRKRSAKGWYDPKAGKITIVVPNHVSVADIEQTMLHEAVAHYGLRKLFGKNFDNFLDNVFRNADVDVRRKIVGMAEKKDWDFRTATEEYLAGLAENTEFENVNASWWGKIKQYFLQMLRKLGLAGTDTEVALTDNELRYILWRSYENLKEPGRYRNVFAEAKDIAMQDKLKVGNYAVKNDVRESSVAEPQDDNGITKTNDRFNSDLQRQIDGTLPKGHIYQLGRPSGKLQSAGIPDLPIELSAERLQEKASPAYSSDHPFDLRGVKDLPLALANPIAVFDSQTKVGTKVILTELSENGNHFVAAVRVRKSDDSRKLDIEVNSIRSIYPKDSKGGILNWINKGLLKWVDKKKASRFFSTQWPNYIAGGKETKGVSSAANIVRNFENPKVEADFNSAGGNGIQLKEREARIEKLLNSEPVELTGTEIEPSHNFRQYRKNANEYGLEHIRGTYVNKDTGQVISVVKKSIKEVTSHDASPVQFQSVAAIPQILEKGIYIGTVKNEDKEKRGDVSSYDYYLCGLRVDGVEYTVKAVVANGINGGSYYDHRLTEIEKGKLISLATAMQNHVSDINIPLSGYKDKRLISVLQAFLSDNRSDGNDIRFREAKVNPASLYEDARQKTYEMKVNTAGFKFTEAVQDNMKSLDELQKAVAGGREIPDWANAYIAENHMSSKSTAEWEYYNRNYFQPLLDSYKKSVKAFKDNFNTEGTEDAARSVLRYLYAKHGIERNRDFAVRDYLNAEQGKAEKAGDEDAVKQLRDSREHYYQEKNKLVESLEKGTITYHEYNHRMDVLAESMFYKPEKAAEKAAKVLAQDRSGLSSVFANEDGTPADDWRQKALDYMDAVEGNKGTRDAVKDLWEKIRKATGETLAKTYNSGMISSESYGHIKDMFHWYIPLRGWEETQANEVYSYVTGAAVPSAFNSVNKKANRRTSAADNPLAFIGNMAQSAIMQGNRNLVKQRLLRLAMAYPSELLKVQETWYVNDGSKEAPDWRVDFPDLDVKDDAATIAQKVRAHEELMKQKEAEGTARRRYSKLDMPVVTLPKEGHEHMVTAFVDGVPKTVMVQGNPRAAQGINGLLNAEVEKDARMRAFQKVNHFLAGAFTSYNPAFIFTNLSRDMVFANQAAYVKEGGAYWRAFTGNQGKVLAQIGGAMGRYTHNRLKPTAFDRYLAEFIDNGGETGYINIHRTEEFKKSILKDVKRLDGGAVNAVKVGAKAIGDWVEFGNRCAEDVNRLAAYITSREMGRSVQQSIDDAKNITVNFNRRGAGNQTDTFWGKWVMPWLTSQYLFVNAGIQSLANVSKMTVKHPARAALVLASLTAMGALVPWLNQVLQALLGTPDGQDDPYGDLPDWIRRNNLCLYIGGGKFITIPLPIELRALYGLGELGYQVYTGGEAKGDIALDVLSQFSQLLPLNVLEGGTDSDGWGERLFMTITPDYAKPFVEAWMNRDWTGKPLYKKTPWNEKAPEWTKAYKGTSKWLVSSAKMLSESTGGDDYKKGDVDINPALVEHFYNGFTGGAGKTLMQVVNLWQLSDKDYRNARNIPLLNRFLTQSDERTAFSQTRRLYYDYLDDVKELKRLDSAYNNDDRYAKKAEALERSPEWKLYEGNEDDIDDIRDLQDELKDNETDLMEQARIQVEINRLMKRVVGRNKAFERAN